MNILIFSQHLFPIQTPRSIRTTELVKEFARQGHSVTIYAVLGKYDYSIFEKQYNVTVKKIPIKLQILAYNSDGDGKRTLLDKILGRLFGKLFQFPNIEFLFNIPSLIKKEKQVDLLISIADPHHIHWGCARAKKINSKIFPKLWIADCGDPFMENGKTKYHYKYFAKFEKSFCSLCDFITVPISSAIEAYYPEFRYKIRVVPQGFSFDLPFEEIFEPKNNVLTFAYAGTFLKDIRNPKFFLEFLCDLKIEFKFIVFTQFNNLILPYKEILKHKLEIRELINRKDLINVLKTMDFLVNIENYNSPNQSPSKLIDYSIANRPILSINPNNLDIKKINNFLKKDYSNKLIVKNIEQYHISNVVNSFFKLTNHQKKVLILAYDFPPYVSVGGLRPFNWYKYFKDFDIYPIVITRQWNNNFGNNFDYITPSEYPKTIIEKTEQGEIIKAPYFSNFSNKLMLKYGESKFKLLRKIISAYFEFFQWIFKIGPKIQILYSADDYLKNNKVDAIIATGDPFILFKYANILSKRHNIPWIADYRDIWSNDLPLENKPIFRAWSRFFEKRIVKNATLITTVSNFVVEKTQSVVKNKEFNIITNGYDPEIIENISTVKQNNSELSIGFVGSIFNWHPYEGFLSVVSNLIKEQKDLNLKINFYGINISDEINELIQKKYSNLLTIVNIYPKMQNNLVLEELAKNNVVLLFNYYSFMGTKIYDYIGIKRRILLCYENDTEANDLREKYYTVNDIATESKQLQIDLIRKTNSGIIAYDKTHLKSILLEFFSEFNSKGFIFCNSINTELFSRKIQTQKLSELIKDIVKA